MEENYFLKICLDALIETDKKSASAIKIVREQTGVGLVQAKTKIDEVLNNFDEIYNYFYSNTIIENGTNIDLENLSIEELQALKEDMEKQKLIDELKAMQTPPLESHSTHTIHPHPHGHPHQHPRMTHEEIVVEERRIHSSCCPKCGGHSITKANKKLGIGKALFGRIEDKKIVCTCLGCGYTWEV